MARVNRKLLNMLDNLNAKVGVPVMPADGRLSSVNGSIVDRAQLAQAQSKAGVDLRYNVDEVEIPGHYINDPDDWFGDQVYVPDTRDIVVTERPGIRRALGEDLLNRVLDVNKNVSPELKKDLERLAGSDGLDKLKDLSPKDRKTIQTAQALVADKLRILGIIGGGAALGSAGAAALADDGNPNDNIQEALTTAGLIGVGGYSGYHAGGSTGGKLRTERELDRQLERLNRNSPDPVRFDQAQPLREGVRGRVMARDARDLGARQRTGAAVGAGAGALLGLIKSFEEETNQPPRYPYLY